MVTIASFDPTFGVTMNSSASPTPSIDSLNGATVSSLCGDPSSSSSSSSGGSNGESSVESGLGGHSLASNTLSHGGMSTNGHSAGHGLVQSSSSASSSGLGSSPQLRGGMGSLLCDLGVSSLLDPPTQSNPVSGSVASSVDSGLCVGCKSRDANSSVARCRHCTGLLCPSCVMTSHQCIHSYEGLGLTSSNTSELVHDLDNVHHLVQEGKLKANELLSNAKNLETTNSRLSNHFVKAKSEVNETFQVFNTVLEERRMEVLRELEATFTNKQLTLQIHNQKAQETIDKMYQTNDFLDRLIKRANNGDVVLLKRPLEQRYSALSSAYSDTIFATSAANNLEQLIDFDYIQPSFAAVQNAVKNSFGFVRSRNESSGSSSSGSGSGSGKQPPISRPVSLSHIGSSNNNSNSLGLSPLLTSANSLNQGPFNAFNGMSLSGPNSLNGLLDRQKSQQTPPAATGYQLGSLSLSSEDSGLLSKRFGRGSSGLGPMLSSGSSGGLGDLSSNGHHSVMATQSNPYEKWSNGGDIKSIFGATPDSSMSAHSVAPAHHHHPQQQQQHHHHHHQGAQLSSLSAGPNGSNSSNEPMLDLCSKLLSTPVFPPKSQIKRQKMIYHCKFGEFGVLEGQFTEPSGVAVNAQNDIIVADTNNHRIQIFDKEGRFKFQFGECGKRDGQLLYPNRVAVVRQSGDIIVTERSPTHQVQIYNQYGQFVRKFGANILQHPRGVCVDNKGRIIVVECKVMRVIIFDQLGNVLNKFGCSKHLEFPNGVVVNDRQEIFISDNRAHCVKVFNYEGTYLRQIGGEGITNYPIGVGINAAGEVTIADNHNNFNLTVFSQDGQLLSALESKVKHAQCFDVSLMDDGSVVLASKDYRLYIYRYVQVPPIGM